MRKFLFSAMTAMLCFLVSCKDTSSAAAGNLNADNEKNRANSKEIYRAIETGDVSKLDSVMDKDILDHGDMGDTHGIDTVKKMFVLYHKQVKDLKMDPIADATDGDYHFSYYHFTGTAADETMGMPAGTKIDMLDLDVTRLKDGKAVEHWGFLQGKDMMKMMSMNPAMKPCMDKMNAAPAKKDTTKM